MSIIGYIRVCSTCGVRMILTAEARHQDLCTPCLDEHMAEVIDNIAETITKNDDPDWPVGEVRG